MKNPRGAPANPKTKKARTQPSSGHKENPRKGSQKGERRPGGKVRGE